jgi:AcrR family transcriptional regulator
MNARQKKFHHTALKLVHEKGFKATTMRELASRMQCDVANIYNYIDSKQSLLDKFLFGINDEFHSGIDHIICSGYNAQRKVEEIVDLYVRLSTEKPLEVALLINEWRNLREDRREQFVSEKRKFENKVKEIIAEGIHEGSLKQRDPDLTTHLLLSSLRSLFNHSFAHDNPIGLRREISGFILNGISNN